MKIKIAVPNGSDSNNKCKNKMKKKVFYFLSAAFVAFQFLVEICPKWSSSENVSAIITEELLFRSMSIQIVAGFECL
jgi:hypothetical protein